MGRPAVLKVDIVADARKVGGGVQQAESKLSRLGSIGKKAGLAVGAGLAVAGLAAGKFALDSIKSASSVQQSFGALDSVYGKNAAKVKAWAAGAADSVGLAKSEYANLSALVGSQLQGMGVAQDKSATKSNDLIKLGADLAATYGGSVNDAVAAVSSTLKGETDPIERYGVSIKQADVNARLASMGLDGLTGKAAKQAQAQAVLSLLTEQTTKAQGAFGRETNTLGGQQERLRAKFENVKATIGQKLLPVATKLVSWASRMLDGSSNLSKRLGPLGNAFSSVGRFITTRAVPAARQFVTWFQDKIVPGIKRYLTPVLNGARSAFGSVAAAVQRNRPQLQQLLSVIGKVVAFFAQRVLPLFGKQIGVAFKITGKVIGGTIDTIAALVTVISNAVRAVKDLIAWVQRIKIPKINLPHVGFGVGNLTTGAPGLAGRSPSLDGRRPLSTASWATAAVGVPVGGFSSAGGGVAGGVTTVDARTFITVDGALDPVSVGQQIVELIERTGRRTGVQLLVSHR